jgi:hypothetical protein
MMKQLRHTRLTKLNGRLLSFTGTYCAQQDNGVNPIGAEKNFIHKRPRYIRT